MAHFAIVAPPFPGHLNPMKALAGELIRRGHRATFFHMADAGRYLRDTGAGFHALGQPSHPPGRLDKMLRRMGRIDGFLGLGGIIRDVAETTDMLARELPGACRAAGIDAVVCDQTEAAGGLVARHLDIPYASVANALPLDREPAVPPPFTGWRYDPSDWGVRRNAGGYRVSDLLMRRHRRVIEEHAGRWKLGPLRSLEDCLSPFAEIAQTVASFDFPRAELPATFHHVGPMRNRPPQGSGDARTGRRAFASLGTLQGGRFGLFRRIARAADRSDLDLVLAHGGGLTPAQERRLGRAEVTAFVDQAAVLSQSRIALLHGGLNTVMDALAAGVPIIVTPIAFEQQAIAARLERSGAGLAVSRRSFGSGPLERAVRRILDEPAFGVAAGRIAHEIAAAGGTGRAADIVEEVARTGRPVAARPQGEGPRHAV